MTHSRKPIVESGMEFVIQRGDKQLFYLEESQAYKEIQEGVKMAELLLLRPESPYKYGSLKQNLVRHVLKHSQSLTNLFKK